MKQIIRLIKRLIGIDDISWVKFKEDESGRTIVTVMRGNGREEKFITTSGISYYSLDNNERASDSLESILYRYYINYYYFNEEEL